MKTKRLINLVVIAVLLNAFALTWVGETRIQATASRCYVNDNASGANTGIDWQNAYTDLQSALNNRSCGEIWVAEGLYKPGPSGEPWATFNLRNKLELFGGFAGTETSLNQRDWETHETVLSGDIDNNDITDANGVVSEIEDIAGVNSYNVVSINSIANLWTVVIDGFTITAGTADEGAGPGCAGGGVYNNGGSLYVANSLFSANRADFEGGGIYSATNLHVNNSTFYNNRAGYGGGAIHSYEMVVVSNSTFSGNNAYFGGGISNYGMATVISSNFSSNYAFRGGGIDNGGEYFYPNPNATLYVSNSAFSENTSHGHGGGIANNNASGYVYNSTFYGNVAVDSGSGGGISNDSGTLTANNNTFSGNYAQTGNTASGFGGGIFNNSGTVSLNSNTFSANRAFVSGAAIYNEAGTVDLVNTIVANSLSGGNCSGSMTNGGGNLSYPDATCPGINSDPLLSPLQNNGGPTLTYALTAGSLAIDSGISAPTPGTDQRGLPRPYDGDSDGSAEYDMGSYEWIASQDIHYSPTISRLPGLIIKENISNFALSFNVGDADSPLSSLNLYADSSDLSLFPLDHILFGGAQADRLIYLTPTENMTGTAAITVTVSDGQLVASDSILVTVNPNNAPVIDPVEDQLGYVSQPMTVTVTASDMDFDMLTFSLGPNAPAGASIDPLTGVFSWTPTSARTFNIPLRVSDGEAEADATFVISVHAKSYIPVIVKPMAGISGNVTMNGQPVQWLTLYLRFFNGYEWSTLATTETDALGNYRFTDVPSLGRGQVYYVRYTNMYDPSRLSGWWTSQITSFTAGGFAHAGDFDLANVELNQPYHGMTMPLPTTFSWVKRAATPSDSYELNLFGLYDYSYYYTPMLGYVNQYTLTSLPPGFEHWTDYGWYMAVYSPDGGYGESYYYNEITFSSGGNNSVDMRDVPPGRLRQPWLRTGMERTEKP